jgi:UDP-N-acetylmuramoylalanine--D-glutamate ligase
MSTPSTQASLLPEALPGEPLHGLPVLVLGLGASGLAMARWCARAGAVVTVADTRSSPPQLATLTKQWPQVRFVAGPFTPALVQGQRLVCKSPGLLPTEIAPIMQAASAEGARAIGELGLFSQALAGLRASQGYMPSLLAITGTNGKTTVTSLTGELVARAGKTVAVAGNIGPTLLDTLAERLDAQSLPDVWVLELSSFQLDGVQGFEPTAAALLNLTQDHLDWHGSMAAYAQAKAAVFGQTAQVVLNRDDAAVMALLPAPVRGKGGRSQPRAHVSFGANVPQRPGDFGLEDVAGITWLVRAQDDGEPRRKGEAPAELYLQRLMPADALRIRGRHNALNALAALALAQAAGCALAPLLYGLREYRGEPHRVQTVGSVQGVSFVDDSKGTNVGATVAALQGLGAELASTGKTGAKLVVILGGVGKGQDFSALAGPVQQVARAVVLIGRDAQPIAQALEATGVPLLDATSMPDAVRQAHAAAQPGDVVLMSPACASFDMFDNYGHRAAVFVQAAAELAAEHGELWEGGA